MGHDPVNDVTRIIWTSLTISLDGKPTANTLMLKMLDQIYAAGLGMMFRCVLIGRAVAAADMTAFGASPQMEPPTACRQTFRAASAPRLGQGIDAVSVRFHRASVGSHRRSTMIHAPYGAVSPPLSTAT